MSCHDARPIRRAFRSITTADTNISATPARPRRTEVEKQRMRIKRPAMNPATPHRTRRPPWEYTLVSRTFFANRGSGSEEHTSELQSLRHLVCRLLLEKK